MTTNRTTIVAATTLMLLLGGATGCSLPSQLNAITDQLESPLYHISAGNGVYITIKRHATGCMKALFNFCKAGGKSDATCGAETLRTARGEIEKGVDGRARQIWFGEYSVFGYHPRIRNGFEDDEGEDFASAVRDLASRTDECLRLHWKPTGENWTTMDDEGYAECSHGKPITYYQVTCDEAGIH